MPIAVQAYGAGQFYPGMPGGQFQAPGGLNPHAPTFQPNGFSQQFGFGGVQSQQQQPQQQQSWGGQQSHRGGFSGPGRESPFGCCSSTCPLTIDVAESHTQVSMSGPHKHHRSMLPSGSVLLD